MITIAKKADVKKRHDSVQPNDTGTIRSPHSLTLSLSWGGGSQTINSSALKSFSPVVIVITILILDMGKIFGNGK